MAQLSLSQALVSLAAMDISGKKALVTGAAERVGKAIALALAEAGADLVLHYNRSAEAAAATGKEAEKLGATVELCQADLVDPSAVDAIMTEPVDILVNSAAGFPEDTLLSVTPEDWVRTLTVNLSSVVFLTQAFAKHLPADREGVVINLTDWKTQRPYTDPRFSYTLSKGGVDTFTRVAASELAPRIRVNALALGVILPPPGAEDGYAERLAARTPLEKVGGVEVVAQAALHLISNDFITGEIVRVDGGAHLR